MYTVINRQYLHNRLAWMEFSASGIVNFVADYNVYILEISSGYNYGNYIYIAALNDNFVILIEGHYKDAQLELGQRRNLDLFSKKMS